MSHYCYVENGELKRGPTTLASHLAGKSDAELKILGWLPFEGKRDPYDKATHQVVNYIKEVQEDKVVFTCNIQPIPS